MLRRLFWRVYDRFFDRVEEDFSFDSSAIDWVREHEPRRLTPLFGATRRNARRIRQLGWVVVGISAWFVASGIRMPQLWPAVHWFQGGFFLGLGGMVIASSSLFSHLALLRGERSDRPRPERADAPARSTPGSRSPESPLLDLPETNDAGLSRGFFWRVYDRFFDRVEEDFQFDSSAIDWVREHEPRRLTPLFGATRRNARRIRQLGWIVVGISAWFLVSGIWMPQLWPGVHWFQGGFFLGLGGMVIASGALFSHLALLRGERSDRPRPEREDAPAH